MARATMDEMVQGVMEYAKRHYNDGGWDVVIECYDEAMIEQVLTEDDVEWKANGKTLTWGAARTVPGAIRKVKRVVVDLMAERQADAINSAF